MTKLDVHPSSIPSSTGTRIGISTARPPVVDTSLERQDRLLVLVPADLDHSAMARQIWELARSTGLSVQLLSLCKDVTEEYVLRRGLAMMSALIQAEGMPVNVKVEMGTSWVEVVKRNHQSGDMVVCFAEQRSGLLQRPLSQILQSNLNVYLYILSSLETQNPPQSNWLSQIMVWTGAVGIIICSFLLQARVSALPQNWIQTTLLLLSVVGEIWLIWVWNSLFS